MNTRWLPIFLAAGALSGAAFDCDLYDCVTPFIRTKTPLPDGSAIPVPSGPFPPGLELPGTVTFVPLQSNSLGQVAGLYSPSPFTSPQVFFFDGVRTTLSLTFDAPSIAGLSDTGKILYTEGPGTVRVTGPPDTAVPYGFALGNTLGDPILDPAGVFQYVPFSAVDIDAAGEAYLVDARKLDFATGQLVSANSRVLVSTTFAPERVPEPDAATLAVAGTLTLLFLRRVKRS